MAVKANASVTITDITDAYSVTLSSETFTFIGDDLGAPVGSSCTTTVTVLCGSAACEVAIGTVICPPGISATVANNNTVSPMIIFEATSIVTTACEATIPITVDSVKFNKKFSFAVAKSGASGIQIVDGTFTQANCREGKGIHVFSSFGPKQDLKYGDPYPAGCGKNLLSDDVAVRYCVKTDDGYISNVNDYYFCELVLVPAFELSAGTKITYSVKSGIENKFISITFRYSDGTTQDFGSAIGGRQATATVPSDGKVVTEILLRFNRSAATFTDTTTVVSEHQLEYGDQATSYAPYANTPPIEGRTELNAVRCEKNLCPGIEVGAYANADGSLMATTIYMRTKKIRIEENAIYTHSTSKGSDPNDVHFWDRDGKWLGRYSVAEINDRPSGAAFMGFNYKDVELTWVQLELGTTATEYEPYNGSSYNLQLGSQIWGADVDWNAGTMTVNMGMNKLPLDWSWTIDSLTNGITCASVGGGALGFRSTAYTYNNAKGACSHMRYIENWNDMSFAHIYVDSYTLIMIAPQSIVGTTSDSINAWLKAQDAAGIPVQVACELAQPYTVQLTPTQISTLKDLNTVYTDADDGRVEYGHDLVNVVNKVVTSTGYVLGEDGLLIDRPNTEMKTMITEDGMIVYKNDNPTLVADNTGVNAVNLYASTYLLIGNNSRLEDWNTNRTACFYIGK